MFLSMDNITYESQIRVAHCTCNVRFYDFFLSAKWYSFFTMLQEMKILIEKLDPEGFGQISFDGFCRGIHDFLGKGLDS